MIATVVGEAIRARLASHRAASPLVVGVCGSQGSGKSTACIAIAKDMQTSGISTAVLSLDDLYLPLAARRDLASRVHPLLRTRGVPGTHDAVLGLTTLHALRDRRAVRLPRFDKSTDDRMAETSWELNDTPLELVLFEGWCIGARPQPDADLASPVNRLEAEEDADGRWRQYANDALARDYQPLFACIDFLVLLAAPAFDVVVRWRIEQERDLRARRGGPGVMPDASIERFVQHYERLTRHILAEMPPRADLVIRLDDNRRVLA